MNCDPLARWYRLIEFAAFGSRLEKYRFHFLPQLADARRALILGEGDGRFLMRLLAVNPHVEIDCIDASARMLERARCRTAVNSRVRFHHADARAFRFAPGRYDLVITNFFLDCFGDAELAPLLSSLADSCAPNARWLITEFHQPESGWRARYAAAWLTVMYAFFRWTTGLCTKGLPQYPRIMHDCGFERVVIKRSFDHLISAELWRRAL